MVANKYLIADQSKILRTKLDNLSTSLQSSLSSGEFQTQEAYLFEAIKILDEFYKSLNEPKLELGLVRADDYPDPSIYNQLWGDLLDDLISIFKEIENIESLIIANFNFVSTESNRLIAKQKSIASKLGDYILFAVDASKDFLYYKDSFNDVSRIDINSPLLNKESGEINQVEGIVTLPINRDKDPRIIIKESPIINSSSNGTAGNNQQLGALWNGNLSALLDSNPDTWFEYERVVTASQDNNETLILDLTLNLGEEKVINHIRINPNNFGTKTVVKIKDIETSLDGEVYTSIKDDIPIAGFTTEDEENVFILAPSTSKYAGQGIYTFSPRKIKYIHFVLTQQEPYSISTSAGDRLRYAIGLRDIDIQALAYKPEGEVVSTSFESIDEIRKVILQTNQNPSEFSDLAEIKYYISPDNGSTWNELTPENIDYQYKTVQSNNSGTIIKRIPKRLEFNGSSTESISTAIPVTNLRVKALLRRDDNAFEEGTFTLQKEILTASELHSIPKVSPFSFNLENAPINKTVVVVDPMFGSRGDINSPYIVGYVQGGNKQSKYRLPFGQIPRPFKKETNGSQYQTAAARANEWIHVEINGEEWTHATQPISSYSGGTNKVFVISINDSVLEFGNDTTSKHPGEDARIDLYFDAERLFPSDEEDNHIAKLDFHTSSNKDAFKIKRYGTEKEFVETLTHNSTIIPLTYREITDYSDIETKLTSLSKTRVTYINGRDELTSDTHWSIDEEAGIIYLRTPVSPDADAIISYSYQPIVELSIDEWDWSTTNILRDSIQIKESAWATISLEESLTPIDDANILELSQLSVENGSLKIETYDAGTLVSDILNPFIREVDYINGRIELKGEATKTIENISSISTGLQTFTLSEKIHDNSIYPVVFSDKTIFSTVQNPPTSPGEYYVNLSTNQVSVYVDTPIPDDFGTITYFYKDPNFDDVGLYSVDYKLGKIYTQRDLDSSWTINTEYEYSDFRAEYRIARLLDSKDYQVDIINRKINIKDSEIFERAMLPYKRPDGFPPQYLVNYDYVAETRESIQDLKEYFSPVIKDYALKVLTKGKIF